MTLGSGNMVSTDDHGTAMSWPQRLLVTDTRASRAPEPTFEHVLRLTDEHGMFEHADGIIPRYDRGYCLDDVARALIVACRQRPRTSDVDNLARTYLSFVVRAQAPDGTCHNRLNRQGRWEDHPDTGDWWGRAVWALGTAAARGPRSIRAAAAARFELSVAQRSPYLHSMAFAVLGAAEVLAHRPRNRRALSLMADYVELVGPTSMQNAWPWPQPRLTYANAAIAEALVAAGAALGEWPVVADGLALLDWLLAVETSGGHLSVTSVGGWGPGETRAIFDQQPIEAAALADACARALALTGESRWASGLDRSIRWFLGDNAGGVVLYDRASGGGFDALTSTGRNTNQGAESTLAMLATMQHRQRVGDGERPAPSSRRWRTGQ
jgi:hypothetical protein